MTIYHKGGGIVNQCAHLLMARHGNHSFIPALQIEQYMAVYHEERLYSVWDSKREILSLVYARDPATAIEKVKGMEVPDG